MTDDLLPWIEETYGHVQEAPDITIWSPDETKDAPINIQDVADLSSITDDYDNIYVQGTITNLRDDELKVLNLLQNDRRIWKDVRFDNSYPQDQPSSPAFFAILIAAMKKTKCLSIKCRFSDTTAYSCLATGLLGHGGIQELELHGTENLEVDAAKVLAEAMVCTTCLQRLALLGDNFRDEHVCAVLVEALKRNRSLGALDLGVRSNPDISLIKFLRALQNHPNLRSLTLRYQNMSEQVMEVLREWLSREDCRLKDLEIHFPSCLPTFSRSVGGKVFEGRTLKRLKLECCSNLASSDLEGLGLCNTFPNLSILSLFNYRICDLSALESILCKEDCKIQDLNLGHNFVSRHSIMSFAAKIPQMKSLRRLYLSENPFLDEICFLDGREQSASLRPLLESVKESKSLERLSMKCKIDATGLCHTMNFNRGGRYGIEVESANRCISLALWPRILHRASSIKYFSNIDSKWFEKVEKPADKSPRAAVVFSLLRDHANMFEHFGKSDEYVPSLPASKKPRLE
eukprot:CAMPEP_0113641550 /NCGR_PEP_ID=MMETSP0017_2-20120614/21811_1 /TAXON_ID=2856 /ORGANISM="Cylindrotheca closterium" /LENGTH=515 /DNA_ID=CAMNT_0000552895 /DNA_START=239 /DNA_END=1786 /DNA_ORIENTATION=- /assembly_acc=CAM_ASM_000147